MTWLSTRVETSHGVDPDQYEPGVPLADQPRVHHVDLSLDTVVVRGSYALTERVALEVQVPLRSVETRAAFEDETGAIRSEFTSIHHRNETIEGIGDVSLAGRFRLIASEGRSASASPGAASEETTVPARPWLLDLVVGVRAPTGRTEKDPFDRGSRGLEHQHVFFGSGTWNPELRLEYHRSGQRFASYGWVGGSGALTDNDKGYRRGFGGSAGLGLSSSLGTARTSFQAQVEVEHSEPSRWESGNARNSGRTDLILAVGVAQRLTDQWILQAQVRVPQNLSAVGGTLEPDVIVMAGASVGLRLGRR